MGSTAVGEKGREDVGPYLLAFLHTQLPADLDTLDGVDEEVPGSILQLVLVKGPREVPAQEDNGVGQKLRAAEGKQGSVWSSQRTCSAWPPTADMVAFVPHCLTQILFRLFFPGFSRKLRSRWQLIPQ